MSKFDAGKFIKLIKSHRILYDAEIKVCNKKNVVERRWFQITGEMTPNFDRLSKKERLKNCKKLKKTWKSMLDNMRRAVKANKVNYIHYKQMEFILPHLGRRGKVETRDQEETNTANNEFSDEEPHLLSLLNNIVEKIDKDNCIHGFLLDNRSLDFMSALQKLSNFPDFMSAVQELNQFTKPVTSAILADLINNIEKKKRELEAEHITNSSEYAEHMDACNSSYQLEMQNDIPLTDIDNMVKDIANTDENMDDLDVKTLLPELYEEIK